MKQEELYKIIKKHYDLLSELKGEYIAVREMRKHISWYIKGLPLATQIRNQINMLESKDEVLELLYMYLVKEV